MLNTYRVYERLSAAFSPEGAKALTETLVEYFSEIENTVTKAELRELQEVVQRLAEAQERSEMRLGRLETGFEALLAAQQKNEERLGRLEAAVSELVAAQQKSEERLGRLEAAVSELVAAQQKSEERLGRLETAVAELVAAQQKNEERLGRLEAAIERLTAAQEKSEERLGRLEAAVTELAAAQRRTEQRVEELAAAQKRTEATVQKLVVGLAETRQMVGGLSDAVGYGLEDRAIKELPRLLAEEHGIRVKGRLVRRFVRYPDGKQDEVNIFGEGERAGEPVTVCGEAKARLARKHVDALCRLGERLTRSGEARHPLFLLLVSYSVEPQVEEYAASRKVTVVPSYLV